MSEVIVADAGPLIALGLIDSIGVLARLHRRVVVPNAVRDECLRMPDKPGTACIQQAFACGWLVLPPEGGPRLSGLRLATLDEGESAAIELAEALGAVLLIDERRGRSVAMERGVPVVGTLGILIAARRRGLIPALAPLARDLAAGGYYLSEALMRAALAKVGEAGDPKT